VRWAFVIALAACGRVGFDPIAGELPPNGDGPPAPHDSGSGSAAPMVDAQPVACAAAIPVTPGVKKTTSTCVGGDHLDGCGPPGTQEVVFELTVPATGSYQVQAFDSLTTNISDSVAQVNAACTATSGACAGILSQSLNAGVYYFIVEDAAGSCGTIDFLVN
jgi:hypothetical protein